MVSLIFQCESRSRHTKHPKHVVKNKRGSITKQNILHHKTAIGHYTNVSKYLTEANKTNEKANAQSGTKRQLPHKNPQNLTLTLKKVQNKVGSKRQMKPADIFQSAVSAGYIIDPRNDLSASLTSNVLPTELVQNTLQKDMLTTPQPVFDPPPTTLDNQVATASTSSESPLETTGLIGPVATTEPFPGTGSTSMEPQPNSSPQDITSHLSSLEGTMAAGLGFNSNQNLQNGRLESDDQDVQKLVTQNENAVFQQQIDLDSKLEEEQKQTKVNVKKQEQLSQALQNFTAEQQNESEQKLLDEQMDLDARLDAKQSSDKSEMDNTQLNQKMMLEEDDSPRKLDGDEMLSSEEKSIREQNEIDRQLMQFSNANQKVSTSKFDPHIVYQDGIQAITHSNAPKVFEIAIHFSL